ncbi:MAG: hypothetical protein U9O83_06170 [Campylobacterota bacterium]|nr:hypothetical protein [Campylobacterota bacterium]
MSAKLKAYPTEYEIYLDGDETPHAKFKMFDSDSFDVEIKSIMSSDELRDIADLLDEVLKLNEVGVEKGMFDEPSN